MNYDDVIAVTIMSSGWQRVWTRELEPVTLWFPVQMVTVDLEDIVSRKMSPRGARSILKNIRL